MKSTIFIQIASYRDPELVPTLDNMFANAKRPKSIKVCIAYQYCDTDIFHKDIDKYRNDDRVILLEIPYKSTKGTCWARNLIQQNYNGEAYTLQLDSHHRFVKNWDDICINMIRQLQDKGYPKPLLTAYLPSYEPDNDPDGRQKEPWWMTFDRFTPEGVIFFLPASIIGWENMTEPLKARFYSAHFCFTLGKFAEEVQHDPDYYFHGEEISIAVRAFTHGYDLFHPHKLVCWHEYTRRGRPKQWDDNQNWVHLDRSSLNKNRILFGMDGYKGDEFNFGRYGFGNERSLRDYEEYAGIHFSTRGIQPETRGNQYPPNPKYDTEEDFLNSFEHIFRHCIDVYPEQVVETDYTFWAVIFEAEDGSEIYRQDAQVDEIERMKNDPDGYYKVWREFHYIGIPYKWVVWTYSQSKGWCERLEGYLPQAIKV